MWIDFKGYQIRADGDGYSIYKNGVYVAGGGRPFTNDVDEMVRHAKIDIEHMVDGSRKPLKE